MKLDDFRRIVLEPDSAKAREMATPQRQKQASSKNTAILAEKVTESPNTAKITNSSVKRVTIVAATKEKSPDKSLLQSRSKQFQLKNETSDVVKSNKSLRISPLKENKESEAVVAETTKLVDESSFFHSVLNKPVIWCSKFVAVCQYLINLPSAILHWCKLQLDYWIFSSPLLPGLVTGSGLLYLASFISMTYPLFALCRLLLGTLYPAYVSYKAVRTKNVREYVKWMMYWIVFAIFTSFETFADVFIAFWFPFYYELKILILLWLISPVSRGSLGSSILYRRFVHPAIMNREEEIDHMILRMQEQGYNTVTRMAGRAFTYVSDFVMQTAIRGGGGLVYQLRKSYSLTDLGNPDDYDDDGSPQRNRPHGSDRFRPLPQITDITDQCEEEESVDPSVRRRIRTNYDRKESSTHQGGGYFFPESDEMIDNHNRRLRSTSNRDAPRHVARTNISSPDNLSSGYSSSTAELSSFLPMSADEMMDTGDYELYNPRVQGFRNRETVPVVRSRSFALRGGGGTPVNTPGGVGAGRGRAPKSKQEDYYSDDDGQLFYSNLERETKLSYPLQHSASIPANKNDLGYWQQPGFYSRSESSVSVDSVYPTSSIDNNDVDDDENWSDTFEDVAEHFGQSKVFEQPKPFAQFPQFLKPNYEDADEDQDKTPVTAKRFNEADLYRVAEKLEHQFITPQEIIAYPSLVIQEKSPSAVSMQNRTMASAPGPTGATETERPVSRASISGTVKKTRAPNPPAQQQQQQQKPSEEIQVRQLPPMSYPSTMTGGLPVKRLSRPITPSGAGSITEGRPGMSYPVNQTSGQAMSNTDPPGGLAELPPTGPIRARQPNFSYPVVKSSTASLTSSTDNSSPSQSPPIEEKRPPFKYPATVTRSSSRGEPEDRLITRTSRRFDSPQPTMRSLSPTSPMLASSDLSTSAPPLSTSPSSVNRCPHCKIHSWLPHSAGCPNKK